MTIKKKDRQGIWIETTEVLKTDVTQIEFDTWPQNISPGDTPLILCPGFYTNSSTSSLAVTDCSISIPLTGSYRIIWQMQYTAYNSSESELMYSQLYKNGTAVGTKKQFKHSDLSGSIMVGGECSEEISCNKGDVLTVWLQKSIGAGGCVVGNLCGCIYWDNHIIGGT